MGCEEASALFWCILHNPLKVPRSLFLSSICSEVCCSCWLRFKKKKQKEKKRRGQSYLWVMDMIVISLSRWKTHCFKLTKLQRLSVQSHFLFFQQFSLLQYGTGGLWWERKPGPTRFVIELDALSCASGLTFSALMQRCWMPQSLLFHCVPVETHYPWRGSWGGKWSQLCKVAINECLASLLGDSSRGVGISSSVAHRKRDWF